MQQKAMMITLMMTMASMMTEVAWGHGMMINPVQRSSMFRYGYPDAPHNYNDNELFCGGFARQWNVHGGKCGICGDDYGDAQPRANEAGGTYANGIIVKTYLQADVIDVTVKITANHLGYFIFKLCPNNDVDKIASQECLDQHVLQVVGDDGQNTGDKFVINDEVGDYYVKLRLPGDVTCTQCVLQWTYNTGNSYGCFEPASPENCCIGCGPQENFVNCADIAITPSGSGGGGNPSTPAPTTATAAPTTATAAPTTATAAPTTATAAPTTATAAPTTATAAPTTTPGSTQAPATPRPTPQATTTKKPSGGCRPTPVYADDPLMQGWCDTNCAVDYCPATHCTCD